MTTIIVTGSRDWTDRDVIDRTLTRLRPSLIVEGGARGADRIAFEWATANKVDTDTIHAEWDRYGKKAGSMRNVAMLKAYPEALVVAFPLPTSIGTYHCIREARRLGRKVMVVEENGNWSNEL